MSGLMTRNGLCHYESRLRECAETAARRVDADLPASLVDRAVADWTAESAADVPALCRTLATLCFDVGGPRCRRRRRAVRDRAARHVAGRLSQTAADHSTTVAACRAYAEFCGRLIDDVAAVGGERNCDDGVCEVCTDRVAEALLAVYRNHRDYVCVDRAGQLLRRLIGGGGQRSLVGDACRTAVMETLIVDRLRALTDNLVDDTF